MRTTSQSCPASKIPVFDPKIPALPARAPGLHRSDHFPMLAELMFEPAGADGHEAIARPPGE
jgi:hypothetical protein